MRQDLLSQLHAAEDAVVRAAVRGVLQGPDLEGFYLHPRGTLPVAVLNRETRLHLNSRSIFVQFSGRRMAKQKRRHGRMGVSDYRC